MVLSQDLLEAVDRRGKELSLPAGGTPLDQTIQISVVV